MTWKLYHPDGTPLPHDKCQMAVALKEGRAIRGAEAIAERPDGTRIWCQPYPTPLFDESGKVVGGINMLVDISERKRTEAALLEANQRKDEFLAMLSHELRTPLSTILGWTQLIERKPDDEKIVRQGIEAITRSSKAQASLISDLLDMSRIISGKMRLEFADVDLRLLVQSAVEALQQTAAEKQNRIERPRDFSATRVRGDTARLQQVLWNLLTNAVKFTPQSGRIQISLSQQASRAILSVSDNGQGIEPNFLPFVFERFRQADASTSRVHGGLGLGLAIVKQLVELHGGQVRVTSPGLGQGSTFTVELPLAATQVACDNRAQIISAQHSVTAMPSLNGIKVLAVDDDGDTRALLKKVLEECRAEVLTADFAEKALRVFSEYAPDVLVSDIGMPHHDGYEFIHKLRASGHSTSAIALSAFARSEDRTQAQSAGYQAHLSKPINLSELITTIAAFAKTPVCSGESR